MSIESQFVQIHTLVEAEFARNKTRFGERMQCRLGCTDCCHHQFDIDSLEAQRISAFVATLPQRDELRKRAMERRRLAGPCPALDPDGACAIYAARPITCRMFGMPIYNPRYPGKLQACELNFKPGEEFDAEGIVERQTEIYELWDNLKARHSNGRRYTVAEAILES